MDNLSLNLPPGNLIHPVYETLKRMITSGELKSGEKIRQEKMASSLGVSRTPLVKALHLLEQEFLVVNIPRRGMYVREINNKELLDAFTCRYALEIAAIRTIAEHINASDLKLLENCFKPYLGQEKIDVDMYQQADIKFHKLIITLSGNIYIEKMIEITDVQSLTYQRGLIRPPKETLSEHLVIIEALEKHQPDQAEEAMKRHILTSLEFLKELFK